MNLVCNNCKNIRNNINKNCEYLAKGSYNHSFIFNVNNIKYIFKINVSSNEDKDYKKYANILNKHILFDNLIYYKSLNFEYKNLNID